MFTPVSGFPVEHNGVTSTPPSLTINAGESVMIVLMDGGAANSTLTLSDGGTNVYAVRGTKSDTRDGITTTLVDCMTPIPGTYTLTMSGQVGLGAMSISKYTGLSSFSAGSFSSALFTSTSPATLPTTTDGIATAAITPTGFPAMMFAAAQTVAGTAGPVVLAAGTGFTSRFNNDTGGDGANGVAIEDLRLTSGSNIASFTASANAGADATVIGAAYLESAPTAAALAGAASDTTSATGALTAPPAPFAPVPLNSGSNQINLGTGANTGTGDPLLTAFEKIAQDYANLNAMMSQIYLNRSTQTPVTGFSITPAQGVTLLVLNPAGTLAVGTVNMPVNPADNQPLTVMTSQTITAITFTPAAGQTMNGAPATLTNTAAVKWIYQAALSAWFREQ
jgi:hypothetical protein